MAAEADWEYPQHQKFERYAAYNLGEHKFRKSNSWRTRSVECPRSKRSILKITKVSERKGMSSWVLHSTIVNIIFFAAVYAARAQKIRDDWVKAMEARIIKEKLDECYRTEGVNHCMYTLLGNVRALDSQRRKLKTRLFIDQNCRDLADLYIKTIKENKVQGFRTSNS